MAGQFRTSAVTDRQKSAQSEANTIIVHFPAGENVCTFFPMDRIILAI